MLLLPVVCASQEHADTLRSVADSGTVLEGHELTAPKRSAKSPGVAMLLSAVVPGAGQVYNGSYWKTPIIAGFGIYFISEWISNNNRVVDYRNQGNTALRDFYKKQRDTFTWYFTILYLLNVADAYVDAALYGFNVSDDLSIRFLPGQGDRVACMRMQISF